MQYTASSFAAPLLVDLRPIERRAHRAVARRAAHPSPSISCSTASRCRCGTRMHRVALRLRATQQGRLHVYLLYVMAALLAHAGLPLAGAAMVMRADSIGDGASPALTVLLLGAPIIPGVIGRTKAIFAGRRGPPVWQLYADLLEARASRDRLQHHDDLGVSSRAHRARGHDGGRRGAASRSTAGAPPCRSPGTPSPSRICWRSADSRSCSRRSTLDRASRAWARAAR